MTNLRRIALLFAVTLVLAAQGCRPAPPAAPTDSGAWREIELATLEDKIRGGWAGQMIGVSFGAPTEFQYLGRIVPEDDMPEWRPERVRGALDQDDLYVDITLATVLDEHGLDATTEDFGARFKDAAYSLWHGNLAESQGAEVAVTHLTVFRPSSARR